MLGKQTNLNQTTYASKLVTENTRAESAVAARMGVTLERSIFVAPN